MDQGTLEGIGTLLALLAFIAVCVWAYSSRNKARFDEAAMLPFADEMAAADEQLAARTEKDSDEINPVTTTKAGEDI